MKPPDCSFVFSLGYALWDMHLRMLACLVPQNFCQQQLICFCFRDPLRDTKVHYVEVVNLRKQLADLQNQIAAAQQQSINLQVALGFRENALRESIQVVEEPEAEVVN